MLTHSMLNNEMIFTCKGVYAICLEVQLINFYVEFIRYFKVLYNTLGTFEVLDQIAKIGRNSFSLEFVLIEQKIETKNKVECYGMKSSDTTVKDTGIYWL